MQSKSVKKIINELSKKYDLSEDVTYKICRSSFDLLHHVISTSDRSTLNFPSVRIPNFGVFYCTEGRRNFYKKLNNKNNGKQG